MRTAACLILLTVMASLTPAQILDKQKLLDAPDLLGQPRLGLVQGQHPVLRVPRRRHRHDVLLPLGTASPSTSPTARPNSGYSFTEFIDRPFWSGRYGAISCPAGHQLYEVRWLARPAYARDYARYWFRTARRPAAATTAPGSPTPSGPSTGSTPTTRSSRDLLPDLDEELRGLGEAALRPGGRPVLADRARRRDGVQHQQPPDAGHPPRRPGYRPTLNAYMWADALAIARVADLAGDTADRRRPTATRPPALKENLQKKLWDPKRAVLLPHVQARRGARTGQRRQGAARCTYQTGQVRRQPARPRADRLRPLAVRPARRQGYEAAWKTLMDTDVLLRPVRPDHRRAATTRCSCSRRRAAGGAGSRGPTRPRRRSRRWPTCSRTTSRTSSRRDDYLKLLQTSTPGRTARTASRTSPRRANPDTGSLEGHDGYNHSEHYFHSRLQRPDHHRPGRASARATTTRSR